MVTPVTGNRPEPNPTRMPEHWEAPWPYGYCAAIENAGAVAAPLLAGFSFALVGLIVPQPQALEWPGATLSLLVASAIAFIVAVQCAFWARQYAITPSDVTGWRPNYERLRQVAIQRLHHQGFQIWASRFRFSYRLGILLLLLGVTLALVPRGELGVGRSFAIGIAAAGFLGELLWIAAGWLLAGSPDSGYDDQSDDPGGTRFLWLRRSRPLRWLARRFIPFVRIQRAI